MAGTLCFDFKWCLRMSEFTIASTMIMITILEARKYNDRYVVIDYFAAQSMTVETIILTIKFNLAHFLLFVSLYRFHWALYSMSVG